MSAVQANIFIEKGRGFLIRFLLPLFLVGVIIALLWLCPAAMSIALWTLLLLALLTRFSPLFNNRILSGLFVAILLSGGIFCFVKSDKIKVNNQYSLQNISQAGSSGNNHPFFSRQGTKIREKVYNFSNSFLLFILPGKRQVAIIFTFVLLLQFYGLKVFHRVLDKRSNSGFEFIAFFVTRVYSRLLAFFFIKSIDVVFVFILWLLALHLLQFDGAFQIALVAGLGILTPIFGMWLGGLFPLFYLQTSDNMIVQIVGVIITLAVIWLFRHIVIPREQFWDINRRTILVLLAIGYLFGNVVGLFIIVPLFVFVRFLVGTFLQGKPLYHKIQKETLPV